MSRAGGRRPVRARILRPSGEGGAALLLLLLLGGVPASAELAFEYRVGASYQSWSWQSYRGDHEASQVAVPLDLTVRPGGSTRISAGADLAWSRFRDPENETRLGLPRELRGAIEQGLFGDRGRIGLGVVGPLSGAELTADEARVASILEEVAPAWPRSAGLAGTRVVLEATVQPVRRRNLLLQAGVGREWRGEHDLTADARRLDPGDLLRFVLGMEAQLGPLHESLLFRREAADPSRIIGAWEYQAGTWTEVALRQQAGTSFGRLGASARFIGRERGEIEAGSPYDATAVRSGNAVQAGLDVSRRMAGGELGLALSRAGVRGFAGDLGHADWTEVGLSWRRSTRRGGWCLAGALQRGSCRGERDLSGLRLELSRLGGRP